MPIKRSLKFILQFSIIGLAAAFVIVFLYPELVGKNNDARPTIEIKETRRTHSDQASANTGMVYSYADAVKAAAPSVVRVHTSKVITKRSNAFTDDPLFHRFFGNQTPGKKERETNLGSGVIVSLEGFILTNNHVIEGADEILVGMSDGTVNKAQVIGADPESDLAVLKIKADKLTPITFGRDKNHQVGDVVLAIGNPFGVGQTVTSGIISATGRDMLGINTFENFIQTDAAINPGNSGGALVNAHGELIGINTAIFSRDGGSQGIGFAIPVSLAKDVMQQIIEHGQVIRGWLGVAIQDLTPQLAESFGIAGKHGVVISNIIVSGPADQAGITRGDVITAINGIAVANVRETLDVISRIHPGKTANISGYREGKSINFKATVIQRPKQGEMVN